MILRSDRLGLYIHWPFCQSKCPYCDFNSHVSQNIDQSAWLAAYVQELDKISLALGPRVIHSIFFGGGTPSLMDIDTVEGVLRKVRDCFSLSNDCEITLEANPTSFETDKFRAFSDCGVNRVSIGVQSLNPQSLVALGRLHSAQEAQQSVNAALDIFPSVSIDLMYGRANQNPQEWRDELTQALKLGTQHISLYQLTIEPGTRFGALHEAGKLRGLPNDETSLTLWNDTLELSALNGFGHYEISNFCKAGHESRHNKTYWQYREYIGVGPGAHGRVILNGQATATLQVLDPKTWLLEPSKRNVSRETLSPTDQAIEKIMMGLRLTQGITQEEWEELSPFVNTKNFKDLVIQGYVSSSENIQITGKGRPLLNAILQQIIA